MHYDKRIGLALGILLIGVVAAFFFRNEKDEHDAIPELEDPQSLDSQIAERNGPYPSKPPAPALTGRIEDDHARGAASPGPVPVRPVPSIWDAAGPQMPGQAGGSEPIAVIAGPPDPIPVSAAHAVGAAAGFPVPGHNMAWQVAGDLPVPAGRPAAGGPASGQLYEIQSGDTLSDLAQRFLGSSARYADLFEANRNILRSPNDLRVGMKIRIPPREPADRADVPVRTISSQAERPFAERPAENQPQQPAATSSDPPAASDSPTVETSERQPESEPPQPMPRRFVPAGRPPFTPSRSNFRSSGGEPAPKPGRTLSQVPPAESADF